jgi:hypothetical protein
VSRRPLKSFEEVCGYGCGKPWRRWNNTRLRGHVLCMISEEAQDEILACAERFPVTQERMAKDLGVPVSYLRAWLAAALKRRRLRHGIRVRA